MIQFSIQLPENNHRRDDATSVLIVLSSHALQTSITFRYAGEFDWITHASRAFKHSGLDASLIIHYR